MRFSLAVAALAPVLSVHAADILVQVGAGGLLAFSPSNISANVGDTVSFQFQGKNHSVTQSSFIDPCSIMTTPAQGINSGFQFVAANATQLPQWSFTVNNASTPLWFFCAQTIPAVHCQMGMVFSVNANEASAKNFAAFQAAAKATNGAAAAASGTVASATAAAGSVIDSGTAAAGSVADSATSAIGSAVSGAVGAGETAAAGAATGVAGALTGLAGALTGAASPTGSASGASVSGSGNGTTPNSGARVGGSAVSLFAVVGLAAGMLL
jgi:plastocyanin